MVKIVNFMLRISLHTYTKGMVGVVSTEKIPLQQILDTGLATAEGSRKGGLRYESVVKRREVRNEVREVRRSKWLFEKNIKAENWKQIIGFSNIIVSVIISRYWKRILFMKWCAENPTFSVCVF